MKRNLLFIALLFISFGVNAQYWSQQYTNMPGTSIGVDQMSIVDSSIVWINGMNGSGAGSSVICANSRTQDGGATWHAGTYSGFTSGVKPAVLCGVSYNKAFCVAYDSVAGVATFWGTTDGVNWSKVTGVLNTGTTTFADGVKFWNNGKGICYGDPVNSHFDIYTTSDSGVTWTAVDTSLIPKSPSGEYGYNGPSCTSIVPGGTAVFMTNKGRVLKTTDYGATWSLTPTAPFSVSANGMIFASSANWIIFANYPLSTSTVESWKYTTDGGTTWDTLSPSGNFYQYQLCYVPGTPNMFVATSPFGATTINGVGYSSDGGLSWTDYLDATYLQPGGSNIQCLGVGFCDSLIGWVGNYNTISPTVSSILKYHPHAIGKDAGAIAILQPSTPTNTGANVQVKVRVQNFGSDTITSMNIAYQVRASAPVSVAWSGILDPDSTLDYTFTTTYVAPDSSSYELCAYTVLTGDIYPSNDKTCATVHGTVGIQEDQLTGLTLDQNFPNPANGITTIGYTVPVSGKMVFSLMNSMGQIIYSESKDVDTGSHNITLNTSPFSAGVYFYEFDFNGSKLYKKMIVN